MKTAQPHERPLGEAGEPSYFDLFPVPPPPDLTSARMAPPPLPPRPTHIDSDPSSASSTSRTTNPSSNSSTRSSLTEGPPSSSTPPFSPRSNTDTTSRSQKNINSDTTSFMAEAAAACAAEARPPPYSASTTCSKSQIQRPPSANALASASAPLARRPLADISSRPPNACLPSSSSSSPSFCNGSSATSTTTRAAASSSPATTTATDRQRGSSRSGSDCAGGSSGGGGGGGSGRLVSGAPIRSSPAPVAARAAATAAPASASSSTLVGFQPAEALSSNTSAKSLPSDSGKQRSWNWNKLGRSLVGTVLGPSAVGRVGDGGFGGKETVWGGNRARHLSEPVVQHMPDGKVNVCVWRKNKQDPQPVKVQVGVYDTVYESGRAAESFCPPEWQEPTKDSRCAVCDTTFGFVYARRHHCRNCGRLVCSSCSETSWPRSMLPSTYRVGTSEKKVRVCNTCHGASESFRKALLSGSEEGAMTAYSTGCVNLRAPYTIYSNELPVHCAAAGGNLNILTWLVEDRCCPLFFDSEKTIALGDSRKVSVIAAAAASGHIHIMRYLALSQGCKVTEIKDINALWCALNKCLHERSDGPPVMDEANSLLSLYPAEALPGGDCGGGTDGGGGGWDGGRSECGGTYPTAPPMPGPGSPRGAEVAHAVNVDNESCIVCWERQVDCTLVPCGHHCCCLICAAQFDQCPVCRANVEQKIRTISV